MNTSLVITKTGFTLEPKMSFCGKISLRMAPDRDPEKSGVTSTGLQLGVPRDPMLAPT